jgi:hypothetical protein
MARSTGLLDWSREALCDPVLRRVALAPRPPLRRRALTATRMSSATVHKVAITGFRRRRRERPALLPPREHLAAPPTFPATHGQQGAGELLTRTALVRCKRRCRTLKPATARRRGTEVHAWSVTQRSWPRPGDAQKDERQASRDAQRPPFSLLDPRRAAAARALKRQTAGYTSRVIVQ